MEGFFAGVVKAARRTAQPYEFTLRAAAAYIGLALLLLIALSVFRVTIFAQPISCTPIAKVSAIKTDTTASCGVMAVAAEAAPDYARAILDHLSSALIISIVVALLILLITTRNQDERHLKAIEPWNIHPALMDALAQTKIYWFRGRSGRFLRDTVLPELDENARKEATQRHVHLLLPDPQAEATMQRYSDYRNSMALSAHDPWTAQRIRNEVLATILRAVEIRANNQFMEIEISVSSSFALYRTDLSEKKLIMTREEPKWPALMCSAGSVFYDSFLEEMRFAHILGHRLQLDNLQFGLRIDAENISPILTQIGLTNAPLDDEGRQAVVDTMNKKSSPYV